MPYIMPIRQRSPAAFTAESTVVGSDYFAGGANTGKLTISKGTFTSESGGTAISMGAGADLTLTGGTFQTQGDGSSYVISLAETATAEISGGSFPGAEAARVVNSSDAFRDGYGVVKNPDGSLSVGVKDESAEAVVIAGMGQNQLPDVECGCESSACQRHRPAAEKSRAHLRHQYCKLWCDH